MEAERTWLTPSRARWLRAAAAAAAVTLAGCGVEAWHLLFGRSRGCWGKGPGWVPPTFAALALAGFGVLAVLLCWAAVLWGRSRASAVTAWALTAVAILCGIGMVLLGRSSYCD
ncbi:hypothetical protein F7Q99_31420 [Streptomyces kaniharaensis]|uniref:Uncharacterized protein n=1 Tax=Streptomyces kaniharaensis TaxID=212423 RepID=A0A6N7L164_9ACTN|nr:hypothetical protein [Streptomyces kaniharaensis]MQS16579.1 hypothetical protein [Streptomyces kaniharaensis]